MGKKRGFPKDTVLDAFIKLQQPFGKHNPHWLEISVLAFQITGGVAEEHLIAVERTLKRLKREKLIQEKTFWGRTYYSLKKSVRDKCLEE